MQSAAAVEPDCFAAEDESAAGASATPLTKKGEERQHEFPVSCRICTFDNLSTSVLCEVCNNPLDFSTSTRLATNGTVIIGTRDLTQLGDISSSVDALMMFLNAVPDVDNLIDALSSTDAPCLSRDAAPDDPNWSREKLQQLIVMHKYLLEVVVISGLSDEQKVALRLYTIESPVKIYDILNFGYKSTNRSPRLLRNSGPFSKILISSIRQLSTVPAYVFKGEAYRGIRLGGTTAFHTNLQYQFDHYKEEFRDGKILTFAPFTSLTYDEKVAEDFTRNEDVHPYDILNEDAILFVFKNVKGVKLGRLSAHPNEKEVLLEPPSMFRVIAQSKFFRKLVVTLESVDAPIKYMS